MDKDGGKLSSRYLTRAENSTEITMPGDRCGNGTGYSRRKRDIHVVAIIIIIIVVVCGRNICFGDLEVTSAGACRYLGSVRTHINI